MKLSRDSNIYKRLENLAPYEKREAIQTEIYSRAKYRMIGYEHIVKIKHINWQPLALDKTAREILNTLDDNKQMYFLSILLLSDQKDTRQNPEIFTIRKEIFADFGHIEFNDDMGKNIDDLSGIDCKEYLKKVWWESRKKAILEPALKVGDSSYGGVNTTDYYLELSTGMTKKEAQDFARRAIEELYDNSEKYQSQLSEVDFMYSICDLEDEKITNTNWADMLFIFDYLKLYSKNGKIKDKFINEIDENLQSYYGYPEITNNDLYCYTYSRSHIRNWMAKIRKNIEDYSPPTD